MKKGRHKETKIKPNGKNVFQFLMFDVYSWVKRISMDPDDIVLYKLHQNASLTQRKFKQLNKFEQWMCALFFILPFILFPILLLLHALLQQQQHHLSTNSIQPTIRECHSFELDKKLPDMKAFTWKRMCTTKW